MKQTGFIVLSLSVIVMAVSIFAADEKPCKQPDTSNLKNCHDPDDRVMSCAEDATYQDCHVDKNVSEYEIAEFPIGTKPATEGSTYTPSTKCWRKNGCSYNFSTEKCEASPVWQAWQYKNKISVDDRPEAVKCPDE